MGHSKISNQKGFSIIEGLIAAALLTIVAVGATSTLQTSAKAKLKNDFLTSIIKYRYNIISNLRSPEGLNKTGQSNGYACLQNQQACGSAATTYANISVLNVANEKLTDKDSASAGFGRDMLACTSFPSKSCPFRFETQWRSVCNSSNAAFCKSPQLKVKGVLKVDPNSGIPINNVLYSFEITLGQVIGSYEQSCTSLGGSYFPGNPPRCQLPMAGDCPSGEIIVGYNKTTKTKTCKPYFLGFFNGITVPPNNVAVGIFPDGSPIIKPIIIPPAPFPNQLPGNPILLQPGNFGGDGAGGDGGCGDGGGGDGCG